MEPVSIGIGALVAKCAARLWIQSDVATDATATLIDILSGHVSDEFEQRRAGRQFEQLTDEIAMRLRPLVDVEMPGMPRNEQIAAALAVKSTLEHGLTSAKLLVESGLDALEFERRLRIADPKAITQAGLGDAGTALYDLLLNEACNYVAQMAEQFPDFNTEATRLMLENDSQVIELMHRVLDGMPQARVPLAWGAGNEDDRFTNRYVKAVAKRADELRLFGVEQEARRRYSLSVAYISLTASISAGPPGAELPSPQNVTSSQEAPPDEDQLLRVEAAVGGHHRVLLGGTAGSGKTTLLQWIAVNACSSGFSGDMEGWNGAIPFILPLRRFVGGPLPKPEDFLQVGYSNLEGVMPQGWVHRHLDAGAALVLIDGLDELPADERDSAREWLQTLMEDYPESRYVVTSRQLAISSDWHDLPNFRYTELQPMQRPDIRAFISHWHSAARHATESQDERERLIVAERHMLAAIRDQAAIRSLCESPLLCALVCALHRDSASQLPQNKMDLYDTALRMLVLTRDVQRDIRIGSPLGLSYVEKRALLEDFALWLHENGASDAPNSTFVERIAAKLKALPHVRHSETEVANELLVRSGVLRKPSEDTVDFVHRTFLEYLAAAALIEDEAIDKIILHSHLDQWREVVVMASGHATQPQRDKLIRGIVARGEDEPHLRHRLFLLAVACRETASVLTPSTRELLASCLREVLPPRNMTEAASVASAGPLAVSQLAGFSGLATTTAACVRALSLIGTDEALESLKGFASDRRLTVSRQIVRAWAQFDGETYAREVLSRSPLDRGHIVVSDPDNMQHLKWLTHLTSVFLDVPGRLDSVRDLDPSDAVVGVDLSHANDMSSFEDLERFPALRTVWMRSCRSLSTLAGVERLPELKRLHLEGCTHLTDISQLAHFSELSYVNLFGTQVDSFDCLSGVTIDSLTIGGSPNVSAIRGALHAKTLNISDLRNVDDFSGLAISLDVSDMSLVEAYGVTEGPTFIIPPNAQTCYIRHFRPIIEIEGGESLLSLDISSWRSPHLPVGLEKLTSLVEIEFHAVANMDLARFPDMPSLRHIRTWDEGPAAIPGFEPTRRRRGHGTFGWTYYERMEG